MHNFHNANQNRSPELLSKRNQQTVHYLMCLVSSYERNCTGSNSQNSYSELRNGQARGAGSYREQSTPFRCHNAQQENPHTLSKVHDFSGHRLNRVDETKRLLRNPSFGKVVIKALMSCGYLCG